MQDILAITGCEFALFDTFAYGKQQDTVYIDIEKTTTHYFDDNKFKSVFVSGELSIASPIGSFKNTFFQDRFVLSKYKNKERFIIDSDSRVIKYAREGQNFTKYSVDFKYYLQLQFNTVRSVFEALDIIIN